MVVAGIPWLGAVMTTWQPATRHLVMTPLELLVKVRKLLVLTFDPLAVRMEKVSLLTLVTR